MATCLMSFNPAMTLLVRTVVEWLEPKPTVVELGNQTFNADDETLRHVLARPRGGLELDTGGLESLLRLPARERRDQTERYYRCLGFSEYQAIDVNETYGSLVMDLNQNLRETYGFSRTFSLVTNNGTGEHVFDQASVLRNVHELTRTGGLMVHLLPSVNYVNHGFYCYQPNLFHALAVANGYRILALGLATRGGRGVVAVPEPEPALAGAILRGERRVDLRALLVKPKRTGWSPPRRIGAWLRRASGASRPGDRLAAALEWLQRARRDLNVFAILRKLEDRSFRVPIQGIYADAISDAELQRAYASPARAE